MQDGSLASENCTVAVVGKDMSFTLIEGDDLAIYIESMKDKDVEMEDVPGPSAPGGGDGEDDDDAMELS